MEGYGPSGEALVRIAKEGARLIVTVDCGAQAFEALEMARAAAVDVIVVDHHKCASTLPVAHALVNPNRLDEADDAASARQSRRSRRLLPVSPPRPSGPSAAAASSAPAAAEPRLVGIARSRPRSAPRRRRFAARAQPRLRRPGFEGDGAAPQHRPRRPHGRIAPDQAPACHELGFALGPRINAGGRVGKSDLGVRLLTTDDPEEARVSPPSSTV
jgi:single-stranded-DNA-specific exonuclease